MIRCFGWPGKVSLVCAIGLCCCLNANAQCKLPPELDAKLRVHPSTDVAIDAGNWFGSHQQFDCAVQSFRAALKTDPNSAQLYYLEGLALANSQHPDEAVEAVRQSTQLDSKVIKPHLLLASLYEQAGRHDDADKQWKLALAIDPRSELALESFSTALLVRKDYIGVVGLLQHAPRTETLTLHLAEALDALNYLDGAMDVLLEAAKLTPDSLSLAKAESVILIKKRSYLEATKLWRYTVAQHPGNRDAELQYLRILVMTQHNDLARPLGLKLLAQTPHDPEILYLNGVVDRAVGDNASAKAHLEEAVAQVPDFFYSRYHLGVVLVSLHEWKEGKENLEKAIALGYTSAEVHYELAMALHGLGEMDRAAQELQQYQDMKKADEGRLEAAARSAQADDELAAGNIQEAIRHYREACDMAPDDGSVKYKLSVALHRAGDLEGERTQLEAAVKLDPKLAAAQKELGYLLSRTGDAAGAVEHFKLAVEAQPAWTDAWINLAAELAVQEHFEDARKAVAMALRLDPGDAGARELSDQLDHDPAAQQAQPREGRN
jgi:tetratricopeptide (TPR) repeat protein